MPIKSNPFVRTLIKSAPIKLPTTPPTPPLTLAPPMTTAAIAFRSNPSPARGCPEFSREAMISPLTADMAPQNMYTRIFTHSTEIPANLAASSFPPIPNTVAPNLVLVKSICPKI